MWQDVADNWWRSFFASPDSLELSSFPSDRETEREVAGLRKLLDLRPGQRIADVCCGWGRHLIRLAQRGFDVVGLDASPMMVAAARALAQKQGVRAAVVRGDAAHLPFSGDSFDVVLNLFNSFGYFSDEGDNVRVLHEAARVLRPGGRLFLDTRNPQFQILYAPYCQLTRTRSGRELVLRCRYDRERKRLESRWSAVDDPGQVVHEAAIRLYGLEEMHELMAAAGFEVRGVYGTYQGEPFEGYQRQMLYVAHKIG